MKGQSVGATELLWPSGLAMLALREITCQNYSTDQATTLDLLWPAGLINEQARLRTRRHLATPIAIIAFTLSLVLAFVIGPMQMILVATVLDYNWVTTVYYPSALNFVFIASGFATLMSLVALALSWRAQPRATFTNITLAVGTFVEIALIWLSGRIYHWPPHTLSLILLITAATFIIATLFVNKQFFRKSQNTTLTRFILSLLMVCALTEICLVIIYLFQPALTHNSIKVEQQATAQAQAQAPGVSRTLSDLTYVLCTSSYQVVYQSQSGTSGLFECANSGEVYSVQEVPERSNKAMFGAATYLGTTNNADVSLTFPSARYLYRSMPVATDEDELVLMYPASSEQELIDNIAQPLLEYWQNHHDRSLFITIFYNDNFSQISSTRDFILMSALDTMAMLSALPHGNTLQGYLNNAIVPYSYKPDTELEALHELGSTPTLYAESSRIALTNSRHLSLHLPKDTELTSETLHELLQNSFTGGFQAN